MKISENGLNLIKEFEGCRLTAYKPVQTEPYWTIGWGHYGADVKEGQTITQVQADKMLKEDMVQYENAVNSICSYLDLNQNQFDALVSFTYNCGAGSLKQLTANGTRTIAQIAEKILLYNKTIAGQELAGLARRRKAEQELFLKASQQIIPSENKNVSEGIVAIIQNTLNNRYGLNIKVDNIYGKETKKALVIALQTELNKQFGKGLKVDGIFGNLTYNACVSVKKGAKGDITWILQALLICNGYNIALDTDFGTNTENAVKSYQALHGLLQDGIAGRNTFRSLLA